MCITFDLLNSQGFHRLIKSLNVLTFPFREATQKCIENLLHYLSRYEAYHRIFRYIFTIRKYFRGLILEITILWILIFLTKD